MLWICVGIAALTTVIAVISVYVREQKLNDVRLSIEEALDDLPGEYKEVMAADHEALEEAQTGENAYAGNPDPQDRSGTANDPKNEKNGNESETIDPNGKLVALTFDDGPSMYTEQILEILNEYDSRATFFMVGYNIEKHPERVQKVLDAGCEVANHTSNHKDLSDISREMIKSEVYDNEKLLNDAGAEGELLLRPPYGLYNDDVKDLVKRPMINWSVDSRDWKTKDAALTVKEVKKNVKDGRVVLMHDIYASTVEAVRELVPWLINEGYRLVTVSQLYEARKEQLKDGHIYRFTYTAEEFAQK
ncbi:MAG: polysaccharide deacetylase family protein [Lachnospiraceae bacterium]|nr:polysaccharide deacetylase family protein [Lachnospiraceae bacterium]